MPLTDADRSEIIELVARYNWALDITRDPEAVADCFTDDGVFVSGNGTGGRARAGLVEYFGGGGERLRPGGAPILRHWTTNHLVEGDGDEATHSAYILLIALARRALASTAPASTATVCAASTVAGSSQSDRCRSTSTLASSAVASGGRLALPARSRPPSRDPRQERAAYVASGCVSALAVGSPTAVHAAMPPASSPTRVKPSSASEAAARVEEKPSAQTRIVRRSGCATRSSRHSEAGSQRHSSVERDTAIEPGITPLARRSSAHRRSITVWSG